MRTNGRINITGPNTADQFSLYDRIPIGNGGGYRDALTGNWKILHYLIYTLAVKIFKMFIMHYVKASMKTQMVDYRSVLKIPIH